MKRGEIYFDNLDPTIGHETKKRRPVLIISHDANNRASETITIIPLTSNITRVYPFEVLLLASETGLTNDSKAQCQQIRTISKHRISFKTPAGLVTTSLSNVHTALKLYLDLLP